MLFLPAEVQNPDARLRRASVMPSKLLVAFPDLEDPRRADTN
jgi:hypothetical protein